MTRTHAMNNYLFRLTNIVRKLISEGANVYTVSGVDASAEHPREFTMYQPDEQGLLKFVYPRDAFTFSLRVSDVPADVRDYLIALWNAEALRRGSTPKFMYVVRA